MTLINPVAGDPLRNWPIQNENNCNTIDTRVGSLAIQTYIPVITGSNENPNLGSTGVIAGFYYLIFDIVYTWGYFRFGGTGIDPGVGTYIVTTPFTMDSQFRVADTSGDGVQLGTGIVYDSSDVTKRQPCIVQARTLEQIQFNLGAEISTQTRAVSGEVSGSPGGVPLTWAADEGVNWTARYKRVTT